MNPGHAHILSGDCARIPCGGACQTQLPELCTGRLDGAGIMFGPGVALPSMSQEPWSCIRAPLHPMPHTTIPAGERVRPEFIWRGKRTGISGSTRKTPCPHLLPEEGSVLKDLVAFNVNPGDEDPFQIRDQVLHSMVAESRFLFKASLHDAVVRERRMIFHRGKRCTDREDL